MLVLSPQMALRFVIYSNGLNYHPYAGDAQNYAFSQIFLKCRHVCLTIVLTCLLRYPMAWQSQHVQNQSFSHIPYFKKDTTIHPVAKAKNLDITPDPSIPASPIQWVIRSYLSYLLSISRMCLLTSQLRLSSTIISHPNYHSHFLIGTPAPFFPFSIPHITGTEMFLENKSDHIVPILKTFHWVPNTLRYKSKLLF